MAREGAGEVEVVDAFGNLVEDWEEWNVPWTDQLDIGVARIEKDMEMLSMGEETRLTLREGKSETGSLELGTEPVGLDRRRVALKKTLTPTDENSSPKCCFAQTGSRNSEEYVVGTCHWPREYLARRYVSD